MTTKILALTDALGNLVRFRLMPGNRFDSIGVAPLVDGVEFGAFIARQGFRQQRYCCRSQQTGLKDCHLATPATRNPNPARRGNVKWRHLIENFFCKLKEFKRIAMRTCKTDQSFEAMIYSPQPS